MSHWGPKGPRRPLTFMNPGIENAVNHTIEIKGVISVRHQVIFIGALQFWKPHVILPRELPFFPLQPKFIRHTYCTLVPWSLYGSQLLFHCLHIPLEPGSKLKSAHSSSGMELGSAFGLPGLLEVFFQNVFNLWDKHHDLEKFHIRILWAPVNPFASRSSYFFLQHEEASHLL